MQEGLSMEAVMIWLLGAAGLVGVLYVTGSALIEKYHKTKRRYLRDLIDAGKDSK